MVDTIAKVVRAEGFAGLYKGLVPNLVGIMPEKAIKLGANDLIRDALADEQGACLPRGRAAGWGSPRDAGNVTLTKGAAAGAMAGFCQCIATNPMEIVKIRMQLASLNGVSTTPMKIVGQLGIPGLYTGVRCPQLGAQRGGAGGSPGAQAAATLARDIPFSIVFFAMYGELKDKWATDAAGNVNFSKVLVSGMGAGAFAAAFTTPIDVVKTRLQVEGAKHTKFTTQFADVLKNEGVPALFKGVGPRMSIIGPLFAVALYSYEVQKWLMKEVLHWV